VRSVDGDAATEAWIERANASGEALFTRTVLDGHPVLRVSVGTRATEARHVATAWDLLRRTADADS
ncbi:MAG: aspartate aminotransferase family protein, partial [Ilumatobacteraceae bacterium]